MKYYLVPEDKIKELIENNITLEALQNGGVDNWEWYGESIYDYAEQFCDFNKETEELEDALYRAQTEQLSHFLKIDCD